MNSESNWLGFFEDRERLYAEYYLDFAQQNARRDPEAYDRLEVESGNLLRVGDWLAEHNKAEGVLKLAEALWQDSNFIRTRGFLQRGLPLLEEAHYAAREIGDSRGEFIWLEVLANLHLDMGNLTEAQPLFEQALSLAQDSDELVLKARSQLDWGRFLMEMNQLEDAINWLKQALQNYRQAQEYNGIIETLVALGNLLSIQGKPAEAISYIEQGLPLARVRQDRQGELSLRFALGYVGTATGDWLMAVKHYETAIDMARAVGNRFLEVRALHNLGECWLELGDIAQAVESLEEALSRQEAIDDVLTKAFTHLYLGKAYHILGKRHEALNQLRLTYPFRDMPLQAASAAEAAWLMADNYLKLRNIDLACVQLHDVLNLAPDDLVEIRSGSKQLLEAIEQGVFEL